MTKFAFNPNPLKFPHREGAEFMQRHLKEQGYDSDLSGTSRNYRVTVRHPEREDTVAHLFDRSFKKGKFKPVWVPKTDE